MNKMRNANEQKSDRIGRFDSTIGVDRDKLIALNERFLTRGAAYRIMAELKDLLNAEENNARIEIKLFDRKTVERFGTIKMKKPIEFVGVNEAGREQSMEIKIILYRWTELVLLHELAHAKNYIEHGRSDHRSLFRRAMGELVERRLEALDMADETTNAIDAPKTKEDRLIAEAIGSTKKSVQSIVCRLRRKGKTKEDRLIAMLKVRAMSADEIAEAIGSTKKSVQSIVCRLRRKGKNIVKCGNKYAIMKRGS